MLIFKQKFPIIYTKDFLYINIFPWKINQNFGFGANQGLNLKEMLVLVDFNYFGGWGVGGWGGGGWGERVNSHVAKSARLVV